MSAMVNPKVTDLPVAAIRRAAGKYPTPFFIYSEKKIRANCRGFQNAFRSFFPSFEPLYAVKANSNPRLLRIIFSEGFGADASSEAEAWIVKQLGGRGMYTGNYTAPDEFRYVARTGAFLLNLDDISMLDTIKKIGVPKFLSFRVNPSISKGGMKSLFLAGPDAKYGVPLGKIVEAYRRARKMGVKRFGIHAMTGSNVLDESYFESVAMILLETAGKIKRELGIRIELMNIGGGFGVPYRPEEKSLDLVKVARIAAALERHGERFHERVFLPAEVEYCLAHKNADQHFAARFAAKEAVMKALGTGWADGVGFRTIEVVRPDDGPPLVLLHGASAERAARLGVQRRHLSLSHSDLYAVAQVVLEGEPPS